MNDSSLSCDNIGTSRSSIQLQFTNEEKDKVLSKIEDLESTFRPYEVASIIFLLHFDAGKAYKDLTNGYFNNGLPIISKWCQEAISAEDMNWKNKFYESLFFIQNFKMLKSFEIVNVDAVHRFNHDYKLPDIRVTFYNMCENIVKKEVESLLNHMNETDDRFIDYLEIYILKWIYEKKISIDDEINITLLVNALKSIDRNDLAKGLLYYCKSDSQMLKTENLNPVQQQAEYPIIDNNNVGLCLIINEETFTINPKCPELKLTDRRGTKIDCERLGKMLEGFNFDIKVVNNVTSENIGRTIHDTVKRFFKAQHSIFILAIMSHGLKGVIFGSDSKPVALTLIDRYLFIPQLQGKPKIIVVQACQGEYSVKSPEIETDGTTILGWPMDTIFCMSTIPLFETYRHHEKGTWYIQTLCEIFEKNPFEDVNTLLTKVNEKLCNEPVFKTEKNVRTIPEFQSRLQKKLYLKKKLPSE